MLSTSRFVHTRHMYVRPLLWKSLPLLIPSRSHNPHQCNCFHLLTIFNQASIYTALLHLFLARLSLLLKTSFLVPTCLWPLLHHQPSVPDYENCLLFTAPVLPVPPSPTKVSRSWSWPSSHLNHCSACVIPAVTLIYFYIIIYLISLSLDWCVCHIPTQAKTAK